MNVQLREARLLRAALGLEGPVDPNAGDWHLWAGLATTERVIPLLFEVVAVADSDLTTEQRKAASTMQLSVAANSVRLEHALIDVAAQFAHKGVPFLVLKGASTAHLDYPDPSQRQFADIDLLVSPLDFQRAIEALGYQGWRQAYALPRHHDRYTHAITLRGESVVEIDLHQHVAHRALGLLIPTERLFDDLVRYEIAGCELGALGPRDRLIHAAVHNISSRSGYRHLSSAADVLRLASAQADDAESILSRAESWRVRSLVEKAIHDSFAAAQIAMPDNWRFAMMKPTRRRDVLVDRAYLSSHRHPMVEELAYLRLMGSWGMRGRYLTGYFSIDREYGPRHRGFFRRSRYLSAKLRNRT